MKPNYRKSWAGNLLMWSDVTVGPCFKVKLGQPNLKVSRKHWILLCITEFPDNDKYLAGLCKYMEVALKVDSKNYINITSSLVARFFTLFRVFQL